MKIRVDFTIDIPDDKVPALIQLSGGETGRIGAARRAADFVRAEAEENILCYLEDSGIPAESVRGIARPGGAW